jgi:hypothetical protein
MSQRYHDSKEMEGRLFGLPLLFVIGAHIMQACACQPPVSACREVAAGSTVFAGTVLSVTPRFLDHWNLSRRPSLTEIVESDDLALREDSPASLEALRNKLRDKLPDLPVVLAKRLGAARTHDQMVRVLEDVFSRGRVVRFRLLTLFSRGSDDDANDKDDKPDQGYIEVATPFGDCGYNFQQGETYLVYAASDEASPTLETGACTPTKRLSDAGADLPFLYFYKENPASAGHLEGIAISDPKVLLNPPDDRDPVLSPMPGLIIGLRSADSVRYSNSGAQGRFVFDGLSPGSYTLRAWAPGYPDTVKLLAGPSEILVGAKSCLNHTLLITPSGLLP